MKKIIGFLVAISIILGITIDNKVFAENTKKDDEHVATETLRDGEEITTMDEKGNVTKATDLDQSGIVKEDQKGRSVTVNKGVVNFRTKSSSGLNTNYTEDGTGRSGYTNGYYAADGAYLGHSEDGTKVKFMQAGVIGWVNSSEVQVLPYTSSGVQAISYYAVANGRIMHYITTNIASTGYPNKLDIGPASKVPELKEGNDYYSYDGHYFYEETNANTGEGYDRMLVDYRNNVRTNAVNVNNPYYNYFQFLSHRSVSNYSASTINTYLNSKTTANSKMKNTGDSFVENQNTYGVNALLMIGVAANESAWGSSSIAVNKNNLFGHAAYDSDPSGSANGYSSPQYSIYHHASQFISYGYLDPISDARYAGAHLGDKGSGVNVKYASDPYWGEKAAAVAWRIDIENGNKDAFKYTIGIKDTINSNHTNSTIKKESTSSSTGLYTTYPQNSSTYNPANYPFIVLGEPTPVNGYYKIQTDVALKNDRSAAEVKPEYNFNINYGYMPTKNTKIVSIGNRLDQIQANVSYQTHVQGIGWQGWKKDGEVSGTSGLSYRLEAMKIELKNMTGSGSIQYQTHIEGIGWQGWKKDGEVSGTSGKALRLEAMQIKLTGEIANYYDVYYRVHAQGFGWMDWAKNGESAGTAGYSYRLEAMEIKLIPKGGAAPGKTANSYRESLIGYKTHVQGVGWQNYVFDGQSAGTTGKSYRLEGIILSLFNQKYAGGLQYQTHIEGIGWQNEVSTGQLSGTSGRALRLEAIRIRLTGEMANKYDIYYRVHAQGFGWMGWAKNGESSGTAGHAYRLEAIEVVLVSKGGSAPGSTSNAFRQR